MTQSFFFTSALFAWECIYLPFPGVWMKGRVFWTLKMRRVFVIKLIKSLLLSVGWLSWIMEGNIIEFFFDKLQPPKKKNYFIHLKSISWEYLRNSSNQITNSKFFLRFLTKVKWTPISVPILSECLFVLVNFVVRRLNKIQTWNICMAAGSLSVSSCLGWFISRPLLLNIWKNIFFI